MANPPVDGLELARQIAMISYRTAASFDRKFNRDIDDKTGTLFVTLLVTLSHSLIHSLTHSLRTGKYQVRKYLEYQGKKFISRFDPISYLKITEQLDSHDVGRDRGGVTTALSTITCPTLIIGIDSDVLYPLYEQEELAKYIPSSAYSVIQSTEGTQSLHFIPLTLLTLLFRS
jgi:homoserine O-acetyltransferase